MEDVIWIELLSRQREVLSRIRCTGPAVRIGRGYANDVILDDPHVAAEHARIFRNEDGALTIEDMGSANGLVQTDGTRVSPIRLDGDHPILLGRTLIRVRDSSFPVPAERAAVGERTLWPALVLLGVAFVGSESLFAWLRQFSELRASWLLTPILIVAGLILGWTTVWAMINRVFSGHARFERSLAIPLIAILAYSLFDEVIYRGAFAFSWSHLPTINYIGAWMAVAGACLAHLLVISPARSAMKAAIVGCLMAVAILLQTAAQYDRLFGDESVGYLHFLQPPWMRIAPPADPDRFFAKVEKLKTRIDKARTLPDR